jgi:hypothetical protein
MVENNTLIILLKSVLCPAYHSQILKINPSDIIKDVVYQCHVVLWGLQQKCTDLKGWEVSSRNLR